MKTAILLGAALLTFWLTGPLWQEDGGGPTTTGSCTVDPDGRPRCPEL